MRIAIAATWVALAACSSAPTPIDAIQVLGSYRLQDGPEVRQNLVLAADGRSIWAEHQYRFGSPRIQRRYGDWQLQGEHVIATDPAGTTRHLTVRRYQGFTYLVPPGEVEFFDRYGPHEELCFALAEAPMLDAQHFLPEPSDRARSDSMR